MSGPLSVAVVTGGHQYDVAGFQRLFRGMDGIDALVQHMDDFAASPQPVRDAYDAVVFYVMLLERPSGEGPEKTALEHLGSTDQGIVVLHHGLLAYPDWPLWSRIVGVDDRRLESYDHDQPLRFRVADRGHPILAGMDGWEMVDEVYQMHDAGEGSRILLAVEHPRSMHTIAWTRRYRSSRVFCYQGGHDAQAWTDPRFREALRRGILWAAARI